MEAAYEFYLKARLHLTRASFNLMNFESNSPTLHHEIKENEQGYQGDGVRILSNSLEDLDQGPVVQQVLGVNWDVKEDQLVFDVSKIAQLMKDTCPMKRNAIGLATRLCDPLGVISPITIRFKLVFQWMCENQLD